MTVPKLVIGALSAALVATACASVDDPPRAAPDNARDEVQTTRQPDPTSVEVPEGLQLEVVASGLNYLTAVTVADDGTVYVGETGGHTYGAAPDVAPPRILRIAPDGGEPEVVYDEAPSVEEIAATETDAEIPEGLIAPVTGLTWRDGLLYVTHRSRVSTLDPATGEFRTIVEGLPAWGEFQNNKVEFGPDGKMYFFVSTQGNAGPVGEHMMEVMAAYGRPDAREVPCEDVTLAGVNFMTPNLLTPDPQDEIATAAYLPPGQDASAGQTVAGQVPCNGAFLRANPDGSQLEAFAWGLRSDFGYAFSPDGRLVTTQNSANPIPPLEIVDDWETIYEVQEGAWYGWPDYYSGLPITDPRFRRPDEERVFQLTEDTHRRLLDGRGAPPQPLVRLQPHAATQGLVFGSEELGVPLDDVLVAEFGNIIPELREEMPGFRVRLIDLDTGDATDFLVNRSGGPASSSDSGGGLERPIQLTYGPDGSLYVADFGIIEIVGNDMSAPPGTGVLWRVSAEGG